MSEFKGTKGKWEIQKLDLPDYKQLAVHSEGEAVALIYLYKDYQITEQKEADALLISKAPEMLEILKEMHNEWCETGISESKLSEYMRQVKQLIKEATEL